MNLILTPKEFTRLVSAVLEADTLAYKMSQLSPDNKDLHLLHLSLQMLHQFLLEPPTSDPYDFITPAGAQFMINKLQEAKSKTCKTLGHCMFRDSSYYTFQDLHNHILAALKILVGLDEEKKDGDNDDAR